MYWNTGFAVGTSVEAQRSSNREANCPGGHNSVTGTEAGEQSSIFMRVTNGPGGGGRTHTALRPPDFESGASASSATPGQQLKIPCRRFTLKTPCGTTPGQLATVRFSVAKRRDATTP